MKEETKVRDTDEVTIRTTNKDGSNVVDIILRVRDGYIVEMFARGAKGTQCEVKKVKFSVRSEELSNDNDECKCCTRHPVTGQITCVTCPCEE